jgi:SM-20-related protein
MPSLPSKLIPEKNILELGELNWTLIDGIFDQDFLITLKSQALALYSQGRFRPAKIGANLREQQKADIRSDEICWLEMDSSSELATQLNGIKSQLNQDFFLGLKDIECHFARYGSGAAYEEHLDQSQFSASKQRVISLVLYLNNNWVPAHGGQLQIRQDNQLVQIEPLFGRLVLMRSDCVPHAVLPSNHERWSLTGWYHRS